MICEEQSEVDLGELEKRKPVSNLGLKQGHSNEDTLYREEEERGRERDSNQTSCSCVVCDALSMKKSYIISHTLDRESH